MFTRTYMQFLHEHHVQRQCFKHVFFSQPTVTKETFKVKLARHGREKLGDSQHLCHDWGSLIRNVKLRKE